MFIRAQPYTCLGIDLVDPRGSGLLFFMFIRAQPYTCLGIECVLGKCYSGLRVHSTMQAESVRTHSQRRHLRRHHCMHHCRQCRRLLPTSVTMSPAAASTAAPAAAVLACALVGCPVQRATRAYRPLASARRRAACAEASAWSVRSASR